MSLIGTIPDRRNADCVWIDGTRTRIGSLTLKPSLRFHSAGSMCTPDLLAGISARVNATRRPVAELDSFFVSAKSLGKGSRQPRFGTPLHFVRPADAVAGSARATAARTR